jgi:hypothetical protein
MIHRIEDPIWKLRRYNLLKNNMDKIDWDMISRNSAAIDCWKKNLYKIDFKVIFKSQLVAYWNGTKKKKKKKKKKLRS